MMRSISGVLTGLCLAAALALTAAGCKTIDRGPSPAEQAQAQFQAGDYARAYTTAARAASTAGGAQRDLANYLAGVSAYRLENLSGAERYLRVAAASRDESLAADARSTLGLIYSRQGRYTEAANALLSGAKLQEGEDRAQAYLYAGIAQQKIGYWPQARTSLLLARKSTRDPGVIQRIDQQLAVTGYTIQVGAFALRSNADEVAQRYAVRAAAGKMGSVVVTEATGSGGRTVNLVHVGRFATFDAANTARGMLGDTNAVIVPLQR